MQVDYAGSCLEIVDLDTGELRPVEVFVAILGASQLTYVDASLSQKKEDFIQSCENALHYFGGVPQAITITLVEYHRLLSPIILNRRLSRAISMNLH